jgi:exonuclease SbcD
VRVIHTADVHLSKEHPERLNALKKVVELSEDEEADLLLITGDLFDANADIEDLKTDLRPIFSDNDFQTLVIPGNHDNAAYRQEDYFGDDIEVLTSQPFTQKKFEDINLLAVPYTEKEFEELVEDLSETVEEDKTNLMMLHCTLSGASGGYGEEEEYMPVKPSQIVQTGFDYILAGHIHSTATRKKFGETTFAYSGSPVSISSSETGRRQAWIIDTEEDSMETRTLETPYYLQEEIDVLPGEEEESRENLLDSLEDRELEKASINLDLQGFTEQTVEDFVENIREDVEDLDADNLEIDKSGAESVSKVVKTDIYTDFKQRLEDKEFEKPELVEKKFLRGLSRNER